jgi:hypothetical protein
MEKVMTHTNQPISRRADPFDGKIAGALNTVTLVLAAVLLFVTLAPA